MNIKKYLLLLLIFWSSLGFSQTLINNQALQFSIKQKNDTINFIVIDTVLTEKKPIFLFLQGSTPLPLFIKEKTGKIFMIGGGISNFEVSAITKHYHLVVISMPKTPVMVDYKHVNKHYNYIPNPDKPDELAEAYLQADYLENYVARAQKVLSFLRKQKWVDNSKLIIAGQSQGTRIATKLALVNKNITAVGLFSPDPFGRLDQYIREARYNAQMGKITWEQADARMKYWVSFFEKVYACKDLEKEPIYKSWKSFSKPLVQDWLSIDIPTYIAYGTEDRTSDLCDIVPLYYIREGKTNLTLKRYLHVEHNFFEVVDGKVDYEKEHWKEVMNAFVTWTLD